MIAARWKTASQPSARRCQSPGWVTSPAKTPRAGSAVTSTPFTSTPSAARRSASARPMKPSAPVTKALRTGSATGEPALVLGGRVGVDGGVELVDPEGARERVAAARGQRRLDAEDAGHPARNEHLVARPLDGARHGLADLLRADPAPATRGIGADRQLGADEHRIDGGHADALVAQLVADRVGEPLDGVLAGSVGGERGGRHPTRAPDHVPHLPPPPPPQ